MGLFDFLKRFNKTEKENKTEAKSLKNEDSSKTIVFESLPVSLDSFKSLPQAAMEVPHETAALTVLALSYYPNDRELSLAMLDYLRGPRPLSPMDKQFIRDRFMDKNYVPRSYFKGASPSNDYTPDLPYTIVIRENPYSYEQENMAKLFISSGGADSPRYITLRLAKDLKWYLWEQYLLADIKPPESSNPWA